MIILSFCCIFIADAWTVGVASPSALASKLAKLAPVLLGSDARRAIAAEERSDFWPLGQLPESSRSLST